MRAFWLLVLPPLAIAGYLAVRVTRDGEAMRRHELQALLDGRLADVRTRASRAVATIERQLGEQLGSSPTAVDELRALARHVPLASAIFRLDREGRLVFPVGNTNASADEREFLERTASIWTGRAILGGGSAEGTTARKTALGRGDSVVDLAAQDDHGWLSWYWAEGLHLLYWRRAGDGGVIGVEVERIGMLARVVGALPTAELEDGRMELADSRGQTVHQWGPLRTGSRPPASPALEAIEHPGAALPRADATLALESPLDSWQLRYFISPAQRHALLGGTETGTLLGIAAATLALLGLAVYLYREYTRRLREAAERVGFVTRVSHELRTPLANIRMYAELMDDAIDDDPEQARRAHVIVSESQRLGRLIDNVLAFARRRHGAATAQVRVDVDQAVRDTVAKFEPAFSSRAIYVRLDLDASAEACAGAGTVEQIVTNLMSNIEKYAPGGEVTITSRVVDNRIVVDVADHGPGVPAGDRVRIFEPFHRSGDRLTSATGTGIGLAIARDLARAAGALR